MIWVTVRISEVEYICKTIVIFHFIYADAVCFLYLLRVYLSNQSLGRPANATIIINLAVCKKNVTEINGSTCGERAKISTQSCVCKRKVASVDAYKIY